MTVLAKLFALAFGAIVVYAAFYGLFWFVAWWLEFRGL